MHQRLLVTFSTDGIETSEQARKYAFNELSHDTSFISDSDSPNRFGGGIADWFKIGGRWSGELTEIKTGQPIKKRDTSVLQRFPRGFPDDAMIVDLVLYDKLLKKYEGTWHSGDKYDFCDLDREDVNEDFVGKKWIVIVDYHY